MWQDWYINHFSGSDATLWINGEFVHKTIKEE